MSFRAPAAALQPLNPAADYLHHRRVMMSAAILGDRPIPARAPTQPASDLHARHRWPNMLVLFCLGPN